MQEYQRQDIHTSSPLQLVVKVYDVAIGACYQGDRRKLRAALTELIASLNIEEGGELAGRLYRIYEYCMDKSVKGDLEDVRVILAGLRDTWKEISVREAA
jgi:flagellin-specific chaperone FliS